MSTLKKLHSLQRGQVISFDNPEQNIITSVKDCDTFHIDSLLNDNSNIVCRKPSESFIKMANNLECQFFNSFSDEINRNNELKELERIKKNNQALNTMVSPRKIKKSVKSPSKDDELFKEFTHDHDEYTTNVSFYSTPASSPLHNLMSVSSHQFDSDAELKRKYGDLTSNLDVNNPNISNRDRYAQAGSGRFSRDRRAIAYNNLIKSQKAKKFLIPNYSPSHLPTVRICHAVEDKSSYSWLLDDEGTNIPSTPHHRHMRLIATGHFEELYSQFKAIERSHNVDLVMNFYRQHAYFPPALLVVSSIAELQGDHNGAMELLRHIINIFEVSIGRKTMEHLVKNKARLTANQDPQYLSNYQVAEFSSLDLNHILVNCFQVSIARYALLISRKSCNEAAVELSKFNINAFASPLPAFTDKLQRVVPTKALSTDYVSDEGNNEYVYVPVKLESLSNLSASIDPARYDMGNSLVVADYYAFRAANYTFIINFFLNHTPYDFTHTMTPTFLDKILFSWDSPVSNSKSQSTDTSHPYSYAPIAACSSPLSSFILPLVITPAKYQINWCFTVALASLKLVGLATNGTSRAGGKVTAQELFTLNLNNHHEMGLWKDQPLSSLSTSTATLMKKGAYPSGLSSSLLLLRAIALFPDVFADLVEEVEPMASADPSWASTLSSLRQLYVSNNYIDKVSIIYVKRCASIWKAHIIDGISIIHVLLSHANQVLEMVKDKVFFTDQVQQVRNVIYNPNFYSAFNYPVKTMQSSDYTDERTSIDMDNIRDDVGMEGGFAIGGDEGAGGISGDLTSELLRMLGGADSLSQLTPDVLNRLVSSLQGGIDVQGMGNRVREGVNSVLSRLTGFLDGNQGIVDEEVDYDEDDEDDEDFDDIARLEQEANSSYDRESMEALDAYAQELQRSNTSSTDNEEDDYQPITLIPAPYYNPDGSVRELSQMELNDYSRDVITALSYDTEQSALWQMCRFLVQQTGIDESLLPPHVRRYLADDGFTQRNNITLSHYGVAPDNILQGDVNSHPVDDDVIDEEELRREFADVEIPNDFEDTTDLDLEAVLANLELLQAIDMSNSTTTSSSQERDSSDNSSDNQVDSEEIDSEHENDDKFGVIGASALLNFLETAVPNVATEFRLHIQNFLDNQRVVEDNEILDNL